MADKKISALPAATTPLAGTEVLPIVQGGTTDQVSVADLTAGRDISTKAITTTGNIGVKCTPLSITPLQVSLGTNRRLSTFLNGSDNVLGFLTDAGNWTGSFYTGNPAVFGNGGAEAFRIDTNQNIVIKTAGKGIDFSANTHAPGMTKEVLDWYEEGNWTPTLAFGGASTGITYALQVGRYTRVGRTVSVQAYLQLSAAGSATGAMTVEGLPFASANVSNYVCIGVCALDNAATSQDQPIARLNSNSTSILVMGGTATDNWFQWTNSGILSANLRVFVSLTYTV